MRTQSFTQIRDHLIQGGVVALPTDTVYGLVADYAQSSAVQTLYELKNRSQEKPFIAFGPKHKLMAWVQAYEPRLEKLVDAVWPGPLTIIIPTPSSVQSIVDTDTIGLRVPDMPKWMPLFEHFEILAATSANIAGKPPAVSAIQIEHQFGNSVLVYEQQFIPKEPSTIIEWKESVCLYHRHGALSARHINQYLQTIQERRFYFENRNCI